MPKWRLSYADAPATPALPPAPWALRGSLIGLVASAVLLVTGLAGPGVAASLARPPVAGLGSRATGVIAAAQLACFARDHAPAPPARLERVAAARGRAGRRKVSFGKIEQPTGTSTVPVSGLPKLSQLSRYNRAEDGPAAGSHPRRAVLAYDYTTVAGLVCPPSRPAAS